MPELPEPIIPPPVDIAALDRAQREQRWREERERWRTTGWGAVGVEYCAGCTETFDGPAYVYDDAFFGRTYTCRRCIDIVTRHSTTPEPCIVCGRKFVWVGGRLWKPGLPKQPRPRRHICSDECTRTHRNRRRRVQRAERTCATCGRPFTPARADAVYCGHACRQRAYRQRTRAGPERGSGLR